LIEKSLLGAKFDEAGIIKALSPVDLVANLGKISSKSLADLLLS